MVTHGKSRLTYGPDEGELLDVLSDPTRRAILESLRASPKPVVQLARELPVSRPAVSQHLKVLKDVGLVRDQPQANKRIYSFDPSGLAPLMTYLNGFWNIALANYAKAAAMAARTQSAGRKKSKRAS